MYVAFLKGMNLGRRRVKNDELCACFEAMGFERVSAFLASGNIVFGSSAKSAPKLEPRIEKGLEQRLEYPVPTFVRSAQEVTEIAAKKPFSDAVLGETAGKLQVAMLSTKPSATSSKAALALASTDDHLALDGRELYWLPKGGLSESELDMKALSKVLGLMTVRTHRTVTRLVDKLG